MSKHEKKMLREKLRSERELQKKVQKFKNKMNKTIVDLNQYQNHEYLRMSPFVSELFTALKEDEKKKKFFYWAEDGKSFFVRRTHDVALLLTKQRQSSQRAQQCMSSWSSFTKQLLNYQFLKTRMEGTLFQVFHPLFNGSSPILPSL
jgi:hypothetical protein